MTSSRFFNEIVYDTILQSQNQKRPLINNFSQNGTFYVIKI